MGSFSVIHWLIALLVIAPVAALMVVPAWRILQRAGHNGAWALLMLVPVLGFVVLWVLAFSKWPNDKDGKTSTSVPGIILGIVLVPLSIVSVMMLSSAGMRVAVPAGQAAAQRQPEPSDLPFDASTARRVPPIEVTSEGHRAPAARSEIEDFLRDAPPHQPSNPFSDPNYGKELSPNVTLTPPSPPPATVRSARQQAEAKHYQRIYAAHPDADAIVTTPEFNSWLSRNSRFRQTLANGTTDEIIEMFSDFKAARVGLVPFTGKLDGQ